MFESVGWGEILVLALIGLFVLGPERLPAAMSWTARTMRTVRDYASGAREQLRSELGPELEELRGPLQDLRSIRAMDPRRAVRDHLFDAPRDGTWSGAPIPATPEPPTSTVYGRPAVDGALKPRSDAPRVLPAAGEPAPFDPDAT